MKFMRRMIAFFLVALSSPAVADITANYIAPNNALTMKVEVASNGDARGATSNPNSYFIVRDGHGYVVQASFDGPAVMRVEDMARVMAEQLKKLMPKIPADRANGAPVFELTKGGMVTIRGRQGIAYYMGSKISGSPTERPIVVISSDPTLAPLGAAMQHQFDMSMGMMGQIIGTSNPFKGMQDILKTGTPLIFTGMELDTINNDPIPAARFALPVAPLTLDGVRKNMGASAQ